MTTQILGVLLSLMALLIQLEAQASEPTASAKNPEINSTASAGLRVYVDPITQELRSEPATPDQAAMANALILPAPNYNLMQTETLPDGSRVLHTNGQIKMTSIGHVNADGTTQEICIPTGTTPAETSTSSSQSVEQKP